MAVSTNYADTFLGMLDAIKNSTSADQWDKIAQYGINAADNPSQILQNAGYDVTVNGKGEIISYTYKGTGSLAGDSVSNIINSNTQTGTASAANTVTFNSIGDVTSEATETGGSVVKGASTLTKFTDGVKGVLNTPVAGKIVPAVLATMTGIKLGKAIDSAIYNIGTAMGADLPSELDPDTWNSITSDMSSEGWEGVNKWAFNTIFGLDPDKGTATAYVDENAFAYMAQYLNTLGAYNTSNQYDVNYNSQNLTFIPFPTPVSTGSDLTVTVTSYGKQTFLCTNKKLNTGEYILVNNLDSSTGYYSFYIYHNGSVYASGLSTYGALTSITNGVYKHWFHAKWAGYDYGNASILWPNITIPDDYLTSSQITNILTNGTLTETSQSNIDGISQIADTSTPELGDITTVDGMLEKLKELYPELWNNRVENTVLQPDGSTKTYTYVPLPIPTGGTGTAVNSTGNTAQTITDPSVSPSTETATDTQIATLIKWLTQTLTPTGGVIPDPTYLPTGMIDPKTGVNPETGKPTTGGTDNPTDTGGGDTPVVVLPSGSASSLYAIYNPTLAQVNSLGSWLWSSDFIDQILKLFSDPMQAIIGLHKIYCTPTTGAEQNIKVGFLDSGVSSKVVTAQYTTIDCGSVNLFEYFGNVFDYDPYTQLRLYLPFIGIVDLDTADAMRGVISVVYHVDVLSGACLAEVKIQRDAAGGTLYQYAGNAAVTMPISSGSYIGVVANVVGVASSAVGGFASGGVAGGIAGGITGALTRRGGTQVQHSGNFSGNAGAMGIKKPYLIIERPQTALAENYADYIGLPSNETVVLSTCSGYIKVKEVHLENIPATGEELTEIDRLLKQGVII